MKHIPTSPDARAREAMQAAEAGSILDDIAEIGRLACAGSAGVPGAGAARTTPGAAARKLLAQYDALVELQYDFPVDDPVADLLGAVARIVNDRFVAVRATELRVAS